MNCLGDPRIHLIWSNELLAESGSFRRYRKVMKEMLQTPTKRQMQTRDTSHDGRSGVSHVFTRALTISVHGN